MRKIYLSLLTLLTSFCCYASALAGDPFTVAGVSVDANGATAIDAQTKAIGQGQVEAATLLIERLTLTSERASNPVGQLKQEDIARLIRALEIANEKRSSQRYLGDITVAFNPSGVKQFLEQRGLRMIATQARPRLVLPVLSGSDITQPNGWETAWAGSKLSHSLTPVQTLSAASIASAGGSTSDIRSANMTTLRNLGRAAGVDQILIAEARETGSGVRVSFKDVALDSGNVSPLSSVNGYNFSSAVAASIKALEDDWKQASVSDMRTAKTISVSVLYRSHNDWLRMKDVINNSAQINDARLDALSKDGALMTLTYGGDFDRLTNEMSFKGVRVRRDPDMGVVMSLTGRGGW